MLFNCPCPWGRVSLARGFARVQSPPVPELPDLDVVADALHAALAGRTLVAARALMPLAVRGTPAELEALVGQRVAGIARARQVPRHRARSGPGRRQPDAHRPVPARRARREGAVGHGGRAVVRAAGRRCPRGRRRLDAGAAWLPADDAPVIVRYRDPTQMGKVYLLPAGVERPCPGSGPGEMGPDAWTRR